MRFAIIFAFGVTALGVAACSAHGSPPPPAPGSDLSTIDGFCEARGVAECNATVVKSCGATTADACVAARKTACLSAVPQGTTYLKDRARACIDTVKGAYEDGQLGSDERIAIDGACGPALFSGPGAARSPCTVDYDCSSADGLSCLIPRGASGGKCLKPNVVGAGAACPNEADVCSDGFYCDAQALTCKTFAVMGEACDEVVRPCGPGLRCGGGGPFGGGCIALAADGAACARDTDCASSMCDKAVGQTEGNCAQSITLSSFDDACAAFK